jgi:hypothetical protein
MDYQGICRMVELEAQEETRQCEPEAEEEARRGDLIL